MQKYNSMNLRLSVGEVFQEAVLSYWSMDLDHDSLFVCLLSRGLTFVHFL